MGAQRDLLLREIRRKEERIEKLLQEACEYRSEISLLAAKETALRIDLDKKIASLREVEKKLQRKELALRQMERRCRAKIKRGMQSRALPEEEKDRRINMLELIIKKICIEYQLPHKEILSLVDICDTEDDSLLSSSICAVSNISTTASTKNENGINNRLIKEKSKSQVDTNSVTDKKEDLIDYLDINGVRSMIDIKIDQTDEE